MKLKEGVFVEEGMNKCGERKECLWRKEQMFGGNNE